jgi:hypothetical protein
MTHRLAQVLGSFCLVAAVVCLGFSREGFACVISRFASVAIPFASVEARIASLTLWIGSCKGVAPRRVRDTPPFQSAGKTNSAPRGAAVAGFPRTKEPAGTVSKTTAPALTTEPAPISTPGAMNAFAAIQLPRRTVTGVVTRSKVSFRKSWEPVQRKARWERQTSLSMVTGAG